MKLAFADTSYWIAVLLPVDRCHKHASIFNNSTHGFRLVTTELVIAEFLNHFSGRGRLLRETACEFTRQFYASASISIITLARIDLSKALDLFEQRADKEWSLMDCTSFILMNQFSIAHALTTDRHFEQAGFTNLLR